MKTILAALDFSEVTPRVVREAADLAAATNGYLILLHVARVPATLPRYATEMASLAVAQRALEAQTEREFKAIKRDLLQRGVVARALRVIAEPAAGIVEQARKLGADYIVMGSHGHSALHDLIIGSTTSAVIKRSNRVVLVVPALPKFRKTPRRIARADAGRA